MRIHTEHEHVPRSGGFTMFFAVLVSSLALAIGIAIYDLVIRELQISSITEQSQYAIFAADTGLECAFYWDTRYNCQTVNGGTTCNSIFATSSSDSNVLTLLANPANYPSVGLCAGNQILLSPNLTVSVSNVDGMTSTDFLVGKYYTTIDVAKTVDAHTLNTTDTTVTGHGYNTSEIQNPSAVERELRSQDWAP